MKWQRQRQLAAVAVAAVVLAGCGTGGNFSAPLAPKSPAQAVFEVKAAEAVALTVFLRYKALPSCAAMPQPAVCSDPKVVLRVQQADLVAAKAIDTAETAARAAAFPAGTVEVLLAAAQSAVTVLVEETSSLKVN